jgi:hypothetical protein
MLEDIGKHVVSFHDGDKKSLDRTPLQWQLRPDCAARSITTEGSTLNL